VVRGTKHKLPADWARRFFYKTRTTGAAKADEPKPDVPTT